MTSGGRIPTILFNKKLLPVPALPKRKKRCKIQIKPFLIRIYNTLRAYQDSIIVPYLDNYPWIFKLLTFVHNYEVRKMLNNYYF